MGHGDHDIATDRMLQLSTPTRGYVDFVEESPLGPLRGNEQRVQVSLDDLPDILKDSMGGRKFRSGILLRYGTPERLSDFHYPQPL